MTSLFHLFAYLPAYYPYGEHGKDTCQVGTSRGHAVKTLKPVGNGAAAAINHSHRYS